MVTIAVTHLLSLAATVIISTEAIAADNPQAEKCYGIVKAGQNDCQTALESCAGSSKADKQADAFIFLPKGVCNKIVDGSLAPLSNKNSKDDTTNNQLK